MNEIDFQSFDEFVVLKPKDHEPIPIFCPMCEFTIRTTDDVMMYKEKKCCYACDTWFLRPEKPFIKDSEYYKKYIDYRKKQISINLNFR
jgi:hypothetical protein